MMKDKRCEIELDYNNYEELLKYFSPKIQKSLRNIPLQEQDDLNQEIHIKIFEKLNVMQSIKAPGFFEFLNCFLIENSYTENKEI